MTECLKLKALLSGGVVVDEAVKLHCRTCLECGGRIDFDSRTVIADRFMNNRPAQNGTGLGVHLPRSGGRR